VLLLLWAAAAAGQTPLINAGGVVNAATFRANQLAPGSIASVFGVGLADTTEIAAGAPLPGSIAGVSVTFDGVPAPLYFVAPGQINLQVPVAIVPPGTNSVRAAVIVRNARGASSPEFVDVTRAAPGVFTQDGTGTGPGVIVVTRPDGMTSLLSPAHPARPGDYLTIYLTGLGATSPHVPDGTAAPGEPAARALESPLVLIGIQRIPVLYAGRAPEWTGLDQINIQIPAETGESCEHVLRIFSAGQLSQPVPVFVRAEGECR
jgi:uncharacterized protein (TIGR03437 family)